MDLNIYKSSLYIILITFVLLFLSDRIKPIQYKKKKDIWFTSEFWTRFGICFGSSIIILIIMYNIRNYSGIREEPAPPGTSITMDVI